MSTLTELHAGYLEARQHALDFDGLDVPGALRAQARYVRGEAIELRNAVLDYLGDQADGVDTTATLTEVRHELADVVLATVTLANLLGVTVEDCIAAKTDHDRGRG